MNTFAVVASTGKRQHVDACGDRLEAKYAKGIFNCIDCGKDVFVRRGKTRAWHFSHYSERDGSKCSYANGGETREHYHAKHFVASNLHRCAFAVEECPSCRKRRFFVGNRDGHCVHLHQCQAEVEMRIPGTSRVADVAVVDPGTRGIVAAIEIFHTHEVDASKMADCAAQGIAVLEVTTTELSGVIASASAGRGKELLLQIGTTNMRRSICDDCNMYMAYGNEVASIAEYERWHNECFWKLSSTRPEMKQLAGTISQDTFCRTVSHEHWYNRLWESHCELLFARNMDKANWRDRCNDIRKGIEAAHEKIHHQEESARNLVHKKHTRISKCVGKCKQCSRWMFEDDELCNVQSGTMTEGSWDYLFKDDNPKYRKMYLRPSSSEHNEITVHDECSMSCPSCSDPALLHNLAKYGICYDCNQAYRRMKTSWEDGLKIRWAKNGDWDLLYPH
jgi:hypothetical protein